MKTCVKIIFLCLVVFASSVFPQEAQKIAEFGTINCESYLAQMDSVMSMSQANPTATIYVFVYEGKTLKYNYRNGQDPVSIFMLPQYGSAKAKILSMKKYISTIRKFPVERFKFIQAGFRENEAIEIWSVPNNETPPKPASTLTKMKYRKGNPQGFCVGF